MQQILRIYRRIFELNQEIERAVAERRLDDLEALDDRLGLLQEEAMTHDGAVRAALRQGGRDEETRELLTLIQRIRALNSTTVPQLQGIMALHRAELQKLRAGNSMLKGYRPFDPSAGGRISSAS